MKKALEMDPHLDRWIMIVAHFYPEVAKSQKGKNEPAPAASYTMSGYVS